MGAEAVSDTGPLIHLSQIDELESLKIVDRLLVPSEVESEFRKGNSFKKLDELEIVEVKQVKGKLADNAGALARKYKLDLGEAEAITLAKTEEISLLFIDDLDGRRTAVMRGLEPHGSVGILLRAYREGIISKEKAVNKVRELHSDSALYLTSDLTKRVIENIEEFSGDEEEN